MYSGKQFNVTFLACLFVYILLINYYDYVSYLSMYLFQIRDLTLTIHVNILTFHFCLLVLCECTYRSYVNVVVMLTENIVCDCILKLDSIFKLQSCSEHE